jgi:hypothetical protein
MKKLLVLIIAIIFFQFLKAQDEYKKFSVGAGSGLNYGGFGVDFTYAPLKFLAVTADAGYNMLNFTGGIGVNLYIRPRTKMYRPNFKILYGYDGVIRAEGDPKYDQSYYGPTLGLGNEIRFGKLKRHGIDLDILVPLRSKDFFNDVDKLQNDPLVPDYYIPKPLAFSLAYHFDF